MNRHANAHPGPGIREAREAIGLSQIGLAYKAGVDLRTVERIERGEVTPRRATLAVIQRVLDDERELAA